MNDESTVPVPFRSDLSYLQPQDIGRLMASLVALGGEVFMLKAEVRRLRAALDARGAVSQADIEAAGASAAFNAWIDAEQKFFAQTLLDPIAGPQPTQARR